MGRIVLFRKQRHEAFDDETVGALCERLGSTPTLSTILAKGRKLSLDTVIGDLDENVKLRIIEASEPMIAQGAQGAGNSEGFEAMMERREKYAVRVKYARVPQASRDSAYRFQSLQELEGLPQQAEARRLLEELANDRGIVAVLEKHRWTVGKLSEMYPDGKVGVDPVCVLGLNVNKGQEIKLRLRTDDLRGFRNIHTIRKTLFHELAHNVHSEHDGKFNALMRQVEEEVTELDWTKSAGRRLAGADESVPERFAGFSTGASVLGGVAVDSTRYAPSEAGVDRSQPRPAGGSGRLGGSGDMGQVLSPAQAAAVALADREMRSADVSRREAVAQEEEVVVQGAVSRALVSDVETSQTAASEPASPTRSTSPSATAAASAAPHATTSSPTELLIARLHAAAAGVRAADASTPRALRTCLRNALQRGEEEQFRRLRAANAAVQARILRVSAAVELLRLAGWRTDTSTGDLILPPSADPTRLFLAQSVLEQGTA